MINHSVVWIRGAIFLSILSVLISLYMGYQANFLHSLENKVWNFFQQQGINSINHSPKPVIITIDDASVQEFGTKPLSRQRILELVRILLDEYKVSIVGLDIFFPDSIDPVAETALLQLAQQHKLVLAQVFSIEDQEERKKVGTLGGEIKQVDSTTMQLFPTALSYIANNKIMASAPCIGHITPKKDWDGGINRIPAFIQWENNLYPAFALEMVRCAMQQEAIEQGYRVKTLAEISKQYHAFQIFDDSISDYLFDRDKLLLDNQGYWRVPYTINAFHQVSALDILKPPNDIELLKNNQKLLNNQMVIIAVTATGMSDSHATPLSPRTQGTTIHIQLIEWLLSDAPLLPASQLDLLAGLWLILSLSLLYFLLFKGVSVFYLLLSNMLLASVWLGLGYYVWITWQWWLPILPLLAYVLFAMLQIPTEWAMTQQRAKQLRQLFQGYLPVPVVDSLVYNNDKTLTEPKRCELSILFADIADFTQRAEACKPEKIAMLTQQILEGLTQVVYECEGTLDKYMGDAVMAFWNAPIKQDNHADLAVQAGIKMIEAIKVFNQTYADDRKFKPITIRIGIHTGVVVVGNLGTKYRHAYTALGDAVNVAARLQEKAKDLQEYLLISETTVSALQQPCNLVKKENVSLRGRKKEVGIYTLSAHNHLPE